MVERIKQIQGDFVERIKGDVRYGLGLFAVIAAAAVMLAKPILGFALLVGVLPALRFRDDPTKLAVTAILPLIVGFIVAFVCAESYRSYQQMALALKHLPSPPPTEWRMWVNRGPAAPADAFGRYGFIAGAVLGAAVAAVGGQRLKHGPGVVRWAPVKRGGWAGPKDVEDRCEFGWPSKAQGGIPLGKLPDTRQLIRVMPNKGKVSVAGHACVIGATGTGKSYSIIRPWIISAAEDGHSIVITDPKGELYADMGAWLKTRGYEVRAFNVVDPRYSDWWNVLAECKDYDEIKTLAAWMITAAGDDHAFFAGGEKNLLDAVMAYAKYALPPEQAHFRSALSLLSWPQDKLGGAFEAAFRTGKIPQDVLETWRAAQGHFTNYVEGVRNKLREMTRGPLAALTSRTDIEMDAIGRQKTALFLILPTEGGDLRALLVSMYGMMFTRLADLAAKSPGGRLPVPVRFILDEFPNIGRIPDIETQLAVGRGRGIMIQIALQNVGQIKGLYSAKRAWETILGNCPIKICLGVDDLGSAGFFTAYAGKAEVYAESESREVTMPWQKLGLRKKRESTKEVSIIQDFELLQLPDEAMIATIRGKAPLYLQKCAWTEYPQAKEIIRAGSYSIYDVYEPKDLTVAVPPYPLEDEDATPKTSKKGRKGKNDNPDEGLADSGKPPAPGSLEDLGL